MLISDSFSLNSSSKHHGYKQDVYWSKEHCPAIKGKLSKINIEILPVNFSWINIMLALLLWQGFILFNPRIKLMIVNFCCYLPVKNVPSIKHLSFIDVNFAYVGLKVLFYKF